ncbi:hypothetical protein ACS0TY_026474 [Phlomoides rotata]
MTRKGLALKVKIAKPMSAGTYGSVFDYCAGRCRHNSESVVHENAYLSEFHHCFSIPSNSSGSSSTQLEARLAGINVIIGRQGESCDSVCKSNGQSCVPNKLPLLNQCDVIKKYMSCKGTCLSSIGADQPAEVADDAPPHLSEKTNTCTRLTPAHACTREDNLHFLAMVHTVIQGDSAHVHKLGLHSRSIFSSFSRI